MRTHVIVPDELVVSIDKLVGPRERSKFFAEAIAEKLARIRRVELAQKLAGSLCDTKIPGWETSTSAIKWVDSLRTSSDTRLKTEK